MKRATDKVQKVSCFNLPPRHLASAAAENQRRHCLFATFLTYKLSWTLSLPQIMSLLSKRRATTGAASLGAYSRAGLLRPSKSLATRAPCSIAYFRVRHYVMRVDPI